jgi:antitoxin (DNA-binding transcriptional repressor) of toxin-antitoxin stability system
MMLTATLEEVQRDLPGWLRRVEAGETVLITRGDEPFAEIRPHEAPSREPRPYGLCAGQFTVPDDFNDPLPEEVLLDFEGR